MANFDLKPLSQDIIQKLGLEGHALWKIKCGEDVFGPFDTPSLTHYAIANTDIMETALACHYESDDFKPFFSHSEFKKVEVTHQQEVEEKIQYWLMEDGLKSQPYPKEHILKKLKNGSLTRYCEVSMDDGHSWKKAPSFPEFAAYFVASTELPRTPHDSSFNRAKTQVMNELENKEESGIKSALPSFAYLAQNQNKAVVLKVDELILQDDDDSPVHVAKALKWAIPGAAVFIAVAVFFGMQVSGQKNSDPLTVENDPISAPEVRARAAAANNKVFNAQKYDQRRPAAYGPRSSLTQQPVFRDDIPTHIETHTDEYGPDLSARESADSPEPEVNMESSLVDNGAPAEEQSLDAAMNVSQAPPPSDPVLEQPDAVEAPAPDQPSDI